MKLNKLSPAVLLFSMIVFFLLFSQTAAGQNIFTPEILAEFDGQTEEESYIAVRGRVYDVTDIFEDGTHMGMEAGQDLTEDLEEGPGVDILEDMEQVGYYVEAAFTPELLERFDGVEREEAYVAVDNLVYDVSEQFAGGTHEGHEAGQDLTDVFHEESPHALDDLSGNDIVGLLVEESMTRAELGDYDAQDGSPMYTAVDGLVYDMADIDIWSEGEHFDHEAGEYLTEAIHRSPHGITVMLDVPIVGALDDFLITVEENDVEEERDVIYFVIIGVGIFAAVSGILLGIHAFRSVLRDI